MKILSGATLALALSAATLWPALTKPAMSQIVLQRPETPGQIVSIDGPDVVIRTADGVVDTYRVDPDVITALKLTPGANVVLTNRTLRGEVEDINRNDILVDLDDGPEVRYIVPEKERKTIAPGETVYITPDQRLNKGPYYFLTARDIRLVYPVAQVPVITPRVETPPPVTPRVITPAPAPAPAPAPVPALW